MANPRNPRAMIPSPVTWRTLPYSLAVGFRAIFRTRPYRPLPRCRARSSTSPWSSHADFTTSTISAPRRPRRSSWARRAPDEARVRRDARLHQLGGLLRLAHGHVGSSGDVDQGAGRAAHVDVHERGVDG